MMVDARLNLLGPLFSDDEISKTYYSMKKFAMGNIHGCVQVWTHKLHKIIQSYRPCPIEPHDAWVNAVANVVSSTYIDKHCFINYRLHGNNVSGYTKNKVQKLRKRLVLYLGEKHPHRDVFCRQLISHLGIYLQEDDCRYKTISMIANYKSSLANKLKLCFSDYIYNCSIQYKCISLVSR